MKRFRADDRHQSRAQEVVDERGATLVEYALLTALVVGATLVAVQSLTTNSGEYLSSTGSNIGEPREHIVDMNPDLPDPPAWLP